MAGNTGRELTPLDIIVRGKARACAIIYIGTIVAIFTVPVMIRLPTMGIATMIVVPFFSFFFGGNWFYVFWGLLLLVDCLACGITTHSLLRWARHPQNVDPAGFYYTYVPYWAHFFTMFMSIFMTLTMCYFQSQCWMISPIGLVFIAIGVSHSFIARWYTHRIYIARLDERYGGRNRAGEHRVWP